MIQKFTKKYLNTMQLTSSKDNTENKKKDKEQSKMALKAKEAYREDRGYESTNHVKHLYYYCPAPVKNRSHFVCYSLASFCQTAFLKKRTKT